MHGVMDLAKKTASPKTYPCKLCMVTYSGATINKLWKQYVVNLGIPAVLVDNPLPLSNGTRSNDLVVR